MKKCMTICFSTLLALVVMSSATNFAADSTLFQIPRIEGIMVDGSSDDWAEQGFRVEFLTDPRGRALPASDFDLKLRIGWNQQGLLVLAEARDDVPLEHESLSRLWQCDCLEIFVAEKLGSPKHYQLVIASGADPKYKTVRSKLYDWRPEDHRIPKLTSLSASRVLEEGYVVEALLPWANLGIEPSLGMEIAFQLVANDYDGETEDADGSLRVAWFPGIGPGNTNLMHRVKLSDKPSKAVLFRVDREINLEGCKISVRGSSELIGDPVVVRRADEVIAEGKLELKEGRAGLQFNLDKKKYGDEWPQAEVAIRGKVVAAFEALPFLDRILEKYIQASGGREAIEKLTTRMCKGQFINELSERKPPKEIFALKAYAKTPYKWLATLHLAEGIEQNGFDGQVGWRQDSDRIQRDSRLARAKLAFLLNPQGALHTQDYFPRMILRAKETLRGRDVFVVEPTALDKTHHMLYFDAQTGLLTQIGYFWELQDYREVDSIKFPFRIAISRKGGSSTFAFDIVKHNLPIDDARFSKPNEGDVFPDAFQGIEDPKVLPMLECKDLTYEHEEMNVPCRDSRFLYDFIIQKNYKRGLEIGTFNGYSTLWFGLAFQKTGGKVITIEIDPVSGQEARRNFKKAGLEEVIDSRINDAFEEIPKIEGKFDFVFIDAWKPDYLKFLRLLKDRVLPGGAIIAHNVTNYARDMRDFLDAIKNDPHLETTFNELSAEGMSISIVQK